MVRHSNELSVMITRWDVDGSRFHPLIYLSDSIYAVIMGRRASASCICVATFIRTPVSPEWYCVAEVNGVGRGLIW